MTRLLEERSVLVRMIVYCLKVDPYSPQTLRFVLSLVKGVVTGG